MAGNSSNVVKLKPVHPRTDAELMPVKKVLEIATHFFQTEFAAMFDVVDDTFFDLADNSPNHGVQTVYFDSMRVLRVAKDEAIRQFVDKLERQFSALTKAQLISHEVKRLETNSIELVDDEHLEEMIALDSMASRLLQDSSWVIDDLNARLTLLMPVVVNSDTNPIGPELVCDIFGASTRNIEIPIQARLVFYKLFERHILSKLPTLYRNVIESLAKLGFEPEIKRKIKKKDSPLNQRGESKNDQASKSDNSTGATTKTQSLVHSEFVSKLFSSLQRISPPKTEPEIQTERASLDEIFLKLGAMRSEQQEPQVIEGRVPLTQIMEAALAASPEPKTLGRQEKTLVTLVDSVLDNFGDQSTLPAQMTPIVQSLKLPILTIALHDAGFFDKPKHPARRLLNEVAQLSLRFGEEVDQQDALYQIIKSLVQMLVDTTDFDAETLTAMFSDFIGEVGNYERRSLVLEKRLLEELDAQEKINEAHTCIAAILEELLLGKSLPKAVVSFVEFGWSRVLFLSFLKTGYNSARWKQDIAILNQLIDALDKAGDADHKDLLASIRSRLEDSAVDARKRDKLLIALLKCFEEEMPPITVKQCSPDLPGKLIEQDSLKASDIDPKLLKEVEALKKGSWVEITADDDLRKRCKLAGITQPSGRYLFVNRYGAKEDVISQAKVALDIEQNKLVLLDNSSLFDEVLAQVVKDLKGQIN